MIFKKLSSLNAKNTWLAIVASLLTLALTGGFIFFYQEKTRYRYHGNYTQVLAQVVREIYQDPTPSNVAAVAAKNGIALRYRNPIFEYASVNDLPAFNEVAILQRLPHGIILARGDEQLVALHRSRNHRLMLRLSDNREMWWTDFYQFLFFIVLLGLLWAGFYLAQRRILLPLRYLRDDMEAVSGGEWRQTAVKQKDEIGELAIMFNRMQHRLRAMLRAKERFLADASHELRSPLARLRMAVEFMDDAKLQEKMKADIAELDVLTGNIMEKTRLDSFRETLRKIPVRISDIIGILREKYPQVNFSSCNCDEKALLDCDLDTLIRAFGNLLDNALTFSSEQVTFHCECQNRAILVVIEDDGPGVPEKDLSHLFEPFYRADASRSRNTGGHGLGLAIVRAAIAAHDGKISAKNNPPKGLRVEVRLPSHKMHVAKSNATNAAKP